MPRQGHEASLPTLRGWRLLPRKSPSCEGGTGISSCRFSLFISPVPEFRDGVSSIPALDTPSASDYQGSETLSNSPSLSAAKGKEASALKDMQMKEVYWFL